MIPLDCAERVRRTVIDKLGGDAYVIVDEKDNFTIFWTKDLSDGRSSYIKKDISKEEMKEEMINNIVDAFIKLASLDTKMQSNYFTVGQIRDICAGVAKTELSDEVVIVAENFLKAMQVVVAFNPEKEVAEYLVGEIDLLNLEN